MSRSAISEIFGFVQREYYHQFKKELPIHYETSPFNATRWRVPIPNGWNGTIGADPSLLVQRNFDKIIYVSRDLIDLSKALAKYHRKASTIDEIIQLAINDPNFFPNIKRKREKLEKTIDDPRFFRFSLNDWNNFTYQTFNDLLDFLEFPTENRLLLIPIKSNRNFEGYSNSHLHKDIFINEKIEEIRAD